MRFGKVGGFVDAEWDYRGLWLGLRVTDDRTI
jgi:hypothetical protein